MEHLNLDGAHQALLVTNKCTDAEMTAQSNLSFKKSLRQEVTEDVFFV